MHIKKLLILSLCFAPSIFSNQALWNAAKEGNFAEVKRILAEDSTVKIDFQNACGETPLINACKRNHFDIVQLLINHRANPNLKENFGNTALILACHQRGQSTRHANDFFNIAQLLIKNGADPNLQTNTGATALQKVCAKHDVKLAALLVLAGANETTVTNPLEQTILNSPIVNFARNLRQWILANEANRQRIPNHENIEKAFDTVQAVDEEKIIAGLMLNNELNIQLAMELVLQFRLDDETFAMNHFNEIYDIYNSLTSIDRLKNKW